MATVWTNVDKYQGQTRQAWDSASLTWDSLTIDWTGTLPTVWTNITKN
jgi:hypothetical protein